MNTDIAHEIWNVDVLSPSEDEIQHEINLLKRHKSFGSDEHPPALFKDADSALLQELESQINTIKTTETVSFE